MTDDSGIKEQFPEGYSLGPFEIRKPLASGTLGDIYKARYRYLDREVALKILHTSDATQWTPDKGAALCRLRHPNIVSVHFAEYIDDRFVIAMDFVEGRTLRDILCEKGKLKVEEALKICSNVVLALTWAHEFSTDGLPFMAHLGLRPAKIFLDSDGMVRVSGFGFVQVVGPGDLPSVVCVASLPYIAPEQFDGTPSPQSDVWAMGILLFEMLLGKRPYEAGSAEEYRLCIGEAQVETVPEFVDLPLPLQGIIQRCLQRDPANRFASAGKLASALTTVGSALGLPQCPTCGADLPRGSEACFECTLAALRESYSKQGGRPLRKTGDAKSSAGFHRVLAWVLAMTGTLIFGGYWIWQNWEPSPFHAQETGEVLPAESTPPSSKPVARESPGDVRDRAVRDPSGENLRVNPAAAREWENFLALETPPHGSYEDRIAQLTRFVELYPGTAESIQAEDKLRIWEAESREYREAEAFERDPGSKMCAILARWQDFDALQTTGLRHAYARERIQHWNWQVQNYLGYAELTVRSAIGLPLEDRNLFGTGKPDPYFELLDGNSVIYRSRVINESSSPVWNEKARIYIWRGLMLDLQIWDFNLLGRDLLMRQTLHPLPLDGSFQVRQGNILVNLDIRRDR